jgi:fructoselysine 6-kinase
MLRINMEKKIKIAAVGDNCIDLYDSTGEIYPGGNPVNVAVYVKRMDGDSSYTGVVGNDYYGKFMVESISKKGVDTSHIKEADGKTAVTYVEIKNGDRLLGEYEEGVMKDFKLTEDDIDFLCSHDLVVTGLWGMVESELHKIKDRGVPVAFDFADNPDEVILNKALPYVDYAFFSNDESGDEELYKFMKYIKSKGPSIVVVTRGERGSIAYDGKEFIKHGISKCEVVDSMGAGKSIKESMEKGAESSSITLGYYGAW